MFWGSSRSRNRIRNYQRLFSARGSSSSSAALSSKGVAVGRMGRPRIRLKPKSILCWAVFLALCYVFVFHAFPIHIDVRDPRFNEQEKCPACYGQSLCRIIFDDRIQLTNWTRFTATRMFNSKNYFHATLETDVGVVEPIILKKLGHDSELRKLDVKFCSLAAQPAPGCRPGHYAKGVVNQYRVKGEIDRSISLKKLKSTVGFDTQTLLDFLVQRFRFNPGSSDLGVGVDDASAADHAFTLLMLGNAEPLLFAAFPASDGWPFPRYLGSCGRLAAFQHAGTRLTEMIDAPWETRVALARQIIDIAIMMSGQNDLGVALYLTDWSPDNLAVSPVDGKVRVVDGGDVILVDVGLVRQEKGPGWDVVHHSGGEQGCDRHFCYSWGDLCTHAESDLNVYGACGGLLADDGFNRDVWKNGGLLHHPPKDVLRKHPLLQRFVSECARPSSPGGRFEAVRELREILKYL